MGSFQVSFLAMMLTMMPFLAQAGQGEAGSKGTSEMAGLATMGTMLGGLIVVLLLVFALAYLVKRFNLTPAGSAVIKVQATTALGTKEKLALVELGGQQYLLGITSTQVTLIDKLEQSLDVPKDSFASRLAQAKLSQRKK